MANFNNLFLRETKNYTSIAKEQIQKKLEHLVLTEGSINIVTKRITRIEGEA